MSEAVVREIVNRAIEDESFRKQLFSNPEQVLKDYDLTIPERATLKGLNKDNFDEFAGKLGGRTTKGAIPGFG